MIIQLTRDALPLGPMGDELGPHWLYDALISTATTPDELADVLDAFQGFILTEQWPESLGTVSDLVSLTL